MITYVELILHTPLGDIILPDFSQLSFDVKYNDLGAIDCTYPLKQAKGLGLADGALVGVRVGFSNGGSLEIARYVLEGTNDDKVLDGIRMRQVTGRDWMAMLDDAIVYPENWPGTAPSGHKFIGATIGTIMATLMTKAQQRGTLTNLSWGSFDGTHDSNGHAWSAVDGTGAQVQALFDMTYSSGQGYYAVIQDFMDRGYADAWVDTSGNLRIYTGGTRGNHVDIGELEVRPAYNVSEASVATDSTETASAVLVEGEEGTAVEVTNPNVAAVLGRRRERFSSQGGVADSGVLTLFGNGEMSLYGKIKSEETIGFAGTLTPFLDFQIGDWIWARYETDQDPVERRVRQIAISVDENRNLTIGGTLNDFIFEEDVKTTRRMNALAGSAGSVYSGGATGADNTIPHPPSDVFVTSGTYMTASGAYSAAATVAWTPTTTNVGGSSATDIDHYEVQWRYQGDSIWGPTLSTADATNSLSFSPLDPGRVIEVQVRAADSSGNTSDWFPTPPAVATLALDTTPPPQPSKPDVISAENGVEVHWDGFSTSAGVPMPPDTRTVEIWRSIYSGTAPGTGDSVKVGNLPVGGGAVKVAGLGDGVLVYIHLVAVDAAGNRSTPSDENDAAAFSVNTPATVPFVGYTSYHYEDLNHTTWGRVDLNWFIVTQDTRGDSIAIKSYEVQVNDEEILTAAGNALSIYPLYPGSTQVYRVRAISDRGVAGDWSAPLTVVVSSDITPPPAPSAPQLSQNRSVLIVRWDGLDLNGAAMPDDFHHCLIKIGGATEGIWYTSHDPEPILVTDLPTDGTPTSVVFQAFDQTGNASADSEVSTIVITPPGFSDLDQSVQDAVNEAKAIAESRGQVFYEDDAPPGTDYTTNDVWYQTPDYRMHRWDGNSWQPVVFGFESGIDAGAAAMDTALLSETIARAAARAGENRIYNGDFALGTPGQSDFGWDMTDPANTSLVTPGMIGSRSVQITSTADTGWQTLRQNPSFYIPVQQNSLEQQYIAFTFRSPSANGAGTMYLRVLFCDQDKNDLTGPGFYQDLAYYGALPADDGIHVIEATFTPRADARYLRYEVIFGGDGVAGRSVVAGRLFQTNVITAGIIAANAITADKIKANSITSEHISVDGLDATDIKTGILNADRIGANSITAEKLIIADMSNLWPFQYGEGGRDPDPNQSWHYDTNGNEADQPTGNPIGKFAYIVGGRDQFAPVNPIPCKPDEQFVIEFDAIQLGTAAVAANQLALWGVTASGDVTNGWLTTLVSASVIQSLDDGWNRYRHVFKISNSGQYVQAKVVWSNSANYGYQAAEKVGITNIVIRRMNAGQLLVDGAITAKIVNGDTIATSTAANTGIKINSNGLTAYDVLGHETVKIDANRATITAGIFQTSSAANTGIRLDATSGLLAFNGGVQTVSLDLNGNLTATGAVLTGGTFRTAASGQRMEMNGAGLQAFDNTGTLVSYLQSANGDLLLTAPAGSGGGTLVTSAGTLIAGVLDQSAAVGVNYYSQVFQGSFYIKDGVVPKNTYNGLTNANTQVYLGGEAGPSGSWVLQAQNRRLRLQNKTHTIEFWAVNQQNPIVVDGWSDTARLQASVGNLAVTNVAGNSARLDSAHPTNGGWAKAEAAWQRAGLYTSTGHFIEVFRDYGFTVNGYMQLDNGNLYLNGGTLFGPGHVQMDGNISAGGTVSAGSASFGSLSTSSGISVGGVVDGQSGLRSSSGLNGTGTVAVNANANGVLVRTGSSRRYKSNIAELPYEVEMLLSLEPHQFMKKMPVDDEAYEDAGFIAEEAEALGLDRFYFRNLEGQVEGFHYDRWTAALQFIVRHQATQIKNLESRINALEGAAS